MNASELKFNVWTWYASTKAKKLPDKVLLNSLTWQILGENSIMGGYFRWEEEHTGSITSWPGKLKKEIRKFECFVVEWNKILKTEVLQKQEKGRSKVKENKLKGKEITFIEYG